MDYNTAEIESRWKKYWSENNTYQVSDDTSKPKYYVLDMFPYPSGAGLHVGHPLGYIATDIFSRYKRQSGFNVLHPMGFDAFGLPAETYAIQTGVHPAKSTNDNIKKYIEQLSNIGFNYDWSRSVKTCDPSYYKWTQWIFTQLFDHYYDKDKDKAVSINKLIQKFEIGGSFSVNAAHALEEDFSAEEWKSFSDVEKNEILMQFRLAYQKIGYVNWCEALGTVLANDQIKDGLSDRGGHPVEKRAMKQWALRITAYAERLLNGLDLVDWSESLKAMQRNWIGRSEGAQVFFNIENNDKKIEVFTTRPDTIFGATYMVLAPEHDWVEELTTSDQKDKIDTYISYVNSRSEIERMSEVKEVTGEFTGSYAINPFTNERIPIWIGEYVLKDYGTGAIMAVPSDDDRDKAFATKFELPIIDVVDKTDYPGASLKDKVGKMINSDFLNGMEVKEAITAAIKAIEEKQLGAGKVNFKMRDTNFSRQRYWGEPFPIRYNEQGIAEALTLDQLPLMLPDTDDFQPAGGGKSPLARNTEWINEEAGYTRETDTMPAVAGSSWYFLRYMDANNPNELASKEKIEYWDSVDLYVGGTEHAVSHLLYSRLWHKFLFDIGIVSSREPFKKLINQGMIQGVIEFIYLQKEKGEGGQNIFVSQEVAQSNPDIEYAMIPVHIDFISSYGSKDSYLDLEGLKKFTKWWPSYKGAKFVSSTATYTDGGEDVDINMVTKSEVGKMSKRYYNVVNPDDMVEQYGADCFRMYEMFLGPIEQSKPWDTNGIDGVSKFLRKFWNLFVSENQLIVEDGTPSAEEMKVLHSTIKKVSEDIEKFSFNTAVSAFMVCVNELRALKCHKKLVLTPLVKLLAPFAPFLSEELWNKLEGEGSIHHQEYPKFDESYLKEDSIEYPISINGKKRASAMIPTDATKDEAEAIALGLETIQKWIEGKEIRKVIFVPKRMINIVV
ncbi:MAG: leucine--tRNA ligase [Saprospiraceae bacterium]|nr:leucine--tRNA ligase [Saprospiraceae bacterium]